MPAIDRWTVSAQLACMPVSLPLADSSGLKAVWASGFIPFRYALDRKYGRRWSRRLREQKRPEVGTDSIYRSCMISHLLYTLTVRLWTRFWLYETFY